jgi:hypothetical protein
VSRVQGCRVTDDEGNAFDIVAPPPARQGQLSLPLRRPE